MFDISQVYIQGLHKFVALPLGSCCVLYYSHYVEDIHKTESYFILSCNKMEVFAMWLNEGFFCLHLLLNLAIYLMLPFQSETHG